LRINDEVVNYDDIGIKSVFGFSGYVLASIFLLTAIMNLDMVFVKHFFSPHDAGIYGSVVTIGKIILYLPGAMSIVLLPKTSEIGKINHDSSKILYRSILITFFICMFVSAIYFLVPNFVVNLMFGEKFLPAVPYIKYYGLAMVFLSILQLCSTYFISVYSKFVLPVVLSVTLLLEIIFFNIFTRNLYHYIFAILSVSFTASLVLLIIVLIKTMKLNHVR
jgi:O-antigen/teichoic acid export membrane protein